MTFALQVWECSDLGEVLRPSHPVEVRPNARGDGVWLLEKAAAALAGVAPNMGTNVALGGKPPVSGDLEGILDHK